MYCNRCGAQVVDNARFCPKCGAPLMEVPPARPAGGPAEQAGKAAPADRADMVPPAGKADPAIKAGSVGQAGQVSLADQAGEAGQAGGAGRVGLAGQAGGAGRVDQTVQATGHAADPQPQAQPPAQSPVQPRPGRRGRVVAGVLLAVALVAGGLGFAWYRGLLDLSFLPSPSDSEPVGTVATPLAITVEAPGLDDGGSRIPVRVTGTTIAGEAFERQTYLSLAENEPIMLEDGTYVVEIIGSPISSEGVIYQFEGASAEVSIGAAADEATTAADGGAASHEDATSANESATPANEGATSADEGGAATDQGATSANSGAAPDESAASNEGAAAPEESATPSATLKLQPIEAADVTDEQIAQAVQWARDDSDRADRAEKLAQAATTRRDEAVPLETRVAAAYEEILDNAASYFAQDWHGMQPEGEPTYILTQMTDDDIPELLLAARYRLTEPRPSMGARVIPFVFDAATGKAVPAVAADGEFEMLGSVDTEYYATGGHALVYATRDGSGAEYPYYRVWIEGTELKREGTNEDIRTGDVFFSNMPVTDRSYLDMAFGKGPADAAQAAAPAEAAQPEAPAEATQPEVPAEPSQPDAPAEQASEHDFECDWFSVDVPESWPSDYWSVAELGEGEWRFTKGSGHDDGGSTDIKVSADGAPSGYSDFVGNAVGPDGQTVGVYKRGAGASFFGGSKATLNLKGV